MTLPSSVHKALAHSYLAYFMFSIVGLFADTFIGFDISVPYATVVAVGCFIIGSILIAWAQRTSSHTVANPDTHTYFYRGPYRFMRNPTHLGIVFLVTGYTLVSGSIVFFTVTAVGYLISNVLFGKYEAILDRTYGHEYQAYKRSIPKIF